MKKIIKTLYFTFLLCLWFMILCLSIELGTRIIIKTANYIYKPYFEHQTNKVYRMVKLSEELKIQIAESNDTNIKGHQENLPIKDELPKNIDESHTCDKNYELTLQGIAEIHLNKDGEIIQSSGDPVIGNFIRKLISGQPTEFYDPAWSDLISSLKHKPALSFSSLLKYENFYRHYYQVQLSTTSGGSILIAKEVRDNYPLSLQYTLPNEDSPWLVTFFAYKPNWQKPGEIAQYNNLGFRDDDIVLPKPEGIFRIVCVGGSTTEEGNSNDMSYPNIMERKLKKYFKTENMDVINAGICGIRSFGEVRKIDDFLNLQPDLLVYYNAVNDICYHYIPDWFKLPNPYKKIIKHSTFLTRIFNRKLLPSDEYIAQYFRENILRNLGAMNCACKKKNIQMAICSFAYPKIKWSNFIARLYYDFNLRNVWISQTDLMITFDTYLKIIQIYNQELKKFCNRENILYIPVAEEFNAGTDHFFDICHMTPIGLDVKTDIIGKHIAKWIEENKLLHARK